MKTRDALLEPGNSIGYRGGDNQLVSTTWRRYTQAEIYCIGVFVFVRRKKTGIHFNQWRKYTKAEFFLKCEYFLHVY